MSYDVELNMPPGPRTPEAILSIKSINLMSHLLDGITYKQLYEESIANILPDVIYRANELHKHAKLNRGAYTNSYQIKPVLVSAFRQIDALLSANPSSVIILGSFFRTRYRSNSVSYRIANLFRWLQEPSTHSTGKNELAHFCMPFMAVQNGSGPVDLTHFAEFLQYFRTFEPKQLYTEAKKDHPTRVGPYKRARERRILQAPLLVANPAGPSPKVVNLGNGYACDPVTNTCKKRNPEDWCNSTTGGPCSLASDFEEEKSLKKRRIRKAG